MDNLLQRLVESFKVSGHEEGIRAIIKEELKSINGEVKEDKLGNLIFKMGDGKEKLMISTSMDEVGLMVTYIEDNGFIRVANIGDINSSSILNKKVIFKNGTVGRIGSSKEKPEVEDVFIDLGLKSKEEVIKVVKEGDVAKVQGEVFNLGENVVGTGLSNIACVYSLINLIKHTNKFNKECYFVFSSQGKLGGRGGRAAVCQVNPDYAIVLSTEESSDYVGGEEKLVLGNGPALVVKDKNLIISHELQEIIENAAEESNIKIQHMVSKNGTEGGPIHKELGGIRTGVISIPTRYQNSMLEMISEKDAKNLQDLLEKII